MPSIFRLALLLAACACAALPARADNQGADDLLPVDQAYVLSASAPSRDRIELRWKIEDGYYLYRHRTGATVEGAGFAAGELQLPPGEPHHDEFFGDVETYRHELVGVLEGTADAGVDTVALKVRYQGCADAGICYPPQTRTVTVALPAEAAGASLPGAPSRGGLPLFGGTAAVDALPLPPERAFAFEAIAGDGNTVLLRFTPAKGYYLYRDRSSFKVEGAPGIAAGAPRWPPGTNHHDEHFGDQVVYFDQADVPLPLLRSRADAADVDVVATFQGCQTDGICYPPMTRTVQVALPAGKVDSVNDAGSNPISGATTDAAASGPTTAPADASAGNANRTRPPSAANGGLLRAVLLALLGGLVLNLMPCVLPILSLKALGLAQAGESREHARRHALWYTLGVLVSFTAVGALAVALRASGQALGWGFQLQQPWFVAALVYLLFALGLSLSGVFTLGGGIGNVGNKLASKSGPAGDFFTGVLACVIASPCIAPFMGGALAYAFASSALGGIVVFLALGLGLALPMLLIGFVPALADKLPKPGAWMQTLKQLLAFPMYLTAVWLLWVLGKQRGADAMALVAAGLAVFALALWWFERKRWNGAAAWRVAALLLAVLALWPAWKVAKLPAAAQHFAESEDRVAYSAEKLQALRGQGRVVFVDVTADWCVTCKANEKAVLEREPFRNALRDADGVYMVGDWTNTDPAITAFLDKYKAVGVPLYVVFPRGGGEGEVLPTVLTEAVVRDALARAAR
ncbi:protein-disulfide reductase DsbD [Pseudoxanthomonas sangjuensis]|uniref:protein-disulfide reductase DsbD family protein n=1 Tax=Pseudoxanthomonas sangjuensis TaxID=1503750 RepID=UPI001391FCCD|nr:protein-disulfide reductase DsbD [Pseudoxanthomonas sangjuensis]KAF1710269.1 cytochrome C biogenesis protein [Pseudoxanthomonas sangjuensis]